MPPEENKNQNQFVSCFFQIYSMDSCNIKCTVTWSQSKIQTHNTNKKMEESNFAWNTLCSMAQRRHNWPE
jgi:hypothetical protein